MREIKKMTFRDKNGNLIEEGDVLIIDTFQKEYQISLVHWDWRRIELGVIPFIQIDKKYVRSEWLAAFATFDEYNGDYEKNCSEIVVKYNSKSALANRDKDPEIIYSGGMPIPKMTRKQAEQIEDYYDYFKDCTLASWNQKVYLRKLKSLIKKLKYIV